MPESSFDKMRKDIASWKVEAYITECNIGALVSFQGRGGRVAPINFLWRNQECLPKPIELPEFPKIPDFPYFPNMDLEPCTAWDLTFGFFEKVVKYDKNNKKVYVDVSQEEWLQVTNSYYPNPPIAQSVYEKILRFGGTGELFSLPYGQIRVRLGNYTTNPNSNNGFPAYNHKAFTLEGISFNGTGDELLALLKFWRGTSEFKNSRLQVINITPPYISNAACSLIPILPPPPPSMTCNCCPNIQQNDELLRLILKKIGSSDLPASVPTSLTNRDKGFTNIENLAQFTAYAVKQLDAVCGKYPIEVKIKDSNLTEEGNQEKTVKLPNIAEGIAEIMGLLLLLKAESGANLSATVRGMIESGASKQISILTHDYAKANAEFLGYKGKQVKHKVPFAFDFKEKKLDKLLKEGEFEVKGFENDDQEDIKDLIMPLLEMAAMYRAANYRKLDANNIQESLKAILTGYNAFASQTKETIDKPKEQRDRKNKENINNPENWDSFLNSAEKGFIEQPGIKDNTEPYDRPFDQRPKIREIGNDVADTED